MLHGMVADSGIGVARAAVAETVLMELTMRGFAQLTASALALAAGVLGVGMDRAAAFPSAVIGVGPQAVVVLVECKYGTPHCVNPNPGPKPPKIGGKKLPDSGWNDPDCKAYGNCNTGGPGEWGDPSIARKGSGQSGQGATAQGAGLPAAH